MGEIRLTSRAEADLAGIADYTIETFGIEQARRYRDDLEGCFRTIAENRVWVGARKPWQQGCGVSSTGRTSSSISWMRAVF